MITYSMLQSVTMLLRMRSDVGEPLSHTCAEFTIVSSPTLGVDLDDNFESVRQSRSVRLRIGTKGAPGMDEAREDG